MHDFAAKRNALFACLDDASNDLKGTVLDQTNFSTALKRNDDGDLEMSYRRGGVDIGKKRTDSVRILHHLRGKESIFKKPELPIARCLKPRKLPDYQINPHKWKKYSLEDVDISDQTNSSAAFQFLRQIDEQKESAVSPEKYDGESKKIEFKKSIKIKRGLRTLQSQEQKDAEIDSPKLKGSKLVMPEYIVGQKKASTLKNNSMNVTYISPEKKQRAAGKLLLSHLQEDDEVEE